MACTSKGTPLSSPQSIAETMAGKHPGQKAPITGVPVPVATLENLEVEPLDVANVIRGASRLTARGYSGDRMDFYRVFGGSFSAGTGESEEGDASALEALTVVVNKLLKGDVPASCGPARRASRLIALVKEQGFDDEGNLIAEKLRPVACGEPLVRLATSCLVKGHRAALAKFFSRDGLQLGVGVKSGVEIATIIINSLTHQVPTRTVALTDCVNAFNEVQREEAIARMRRAGFGDFSNHVLLLYKESSKLYLRGADGSMRLLFSSEGSRQGCPFGGPLFCFGLHECLVNVKNAFAGRDLNIIAIADDVSLVGEDSVVREAYEMLKLEYAKVGLSMNDDKLKVWSRAGTPDVEAWTNIGIDGDENLIPCDRGVRVLGVPIGSDAWTRQWCLDYVADRVAPKCEALLKNPHFQDRFLMLRLCCNTSITHLLRTVPPHLVHPAARVFDELIHSTFLQVVGLNEELLPFHSAEWDAITFPPRFGGMGLVKSERISDAAFLAGQLTVLLHGVLEDYGAAIEPVYGHLGERTGPGAVVKSRVLDTWEQLQKTYQGSFASIFLPKGVCDLSKARSMACLYPKGSREGALGSATLHPKLQREISTMIHRYEFNAFMKEGVEGANSNELKALVRSAMLPGGSLFATLVPSTRELQIPNDAYLCFLCMKYGINCPLLEVAASAVDSCPLFSQTRRNCGRIIDDLHMHFCQTVSNGPNRIHNAVVRWLAAVAGRLAGRAPVVYERRWVCSTLPKLKPFDVLFEPGKLKTLAIDASVVTPNAPSNSKRAANTTGITALRTESEKQSKFDNLASSVSCVNAHEYSPFVTEITGGVGSCANTILHEWAVVAVPGDPEDPAVRRARSVWLTAARKGLMVTIARSYHRVVTDKHRAISDALEKERHTDALHSIPSPSRSSLPEDYGHYGPACDDEGLDVDHWGRHVMMRGGDENVSPNRDVFVRAIN